MFIEIWEALSEQEPKKISVTFLNSTLNRKQVLQNIL